MSTIRFVFDGNSVGPDNTPNEVSVHKCPVSSIKIDSMYLQLEMEDDDTIEVFQQQTGGSC